MSGDASPRKVKATRLATQRIGKGWRQEDLAEAAGLSRATYQRLESGRMPNPPLRYLVNLSIVLDCELDDLIEDEWREWMPLNGIKSPPHQS